MPYTTKQTRLTRAEREFSPPGVPEPHYPMLYPDFTHFRIRRDEEIRLVDDHAKRENGFGVWTRTAFWT
ncbi:uncharacterized protein ColSpa_01791 [Colletotrichum spaethianum]|uniref:Uncharacterized protein n=1 Tax=Colletotrichum spaethianum TaxID=700344 RepID=A0AA37L7K2_9PEZI|nr:uncharacterized protein ColSpa_01791 [Colletotrichum spaethianum]GKT41610.1 hypothetical protein ColSpa_01791 [Colletotrichum spaethianum]